MGYSIVKELCERGIAVIAFARTKEKLEKLFGAEPNVTIITGDIFFRVEDLQAAARGVEVIFQAANIPYADWEGKTSCLYDKYCPCSEGTVRKACDCR
ncbi:hypothetical protein GCM10020331_070610 [Ectobacillus funiculus]